MVLVILLLPAFDIPRSHCSCPRLRLSSLAPHPQKSYSPRSLSTPTTYEISHVRPDTYTPVMTPTGWVRGTSAIERFPGRRPPVRRYIIMPGPTINRVCRFHQLVYPRLSRTLRNIQCNQCWERLLPWGTKSVKTQVVPPFQEHTTGGIFCVSPIPYPQAHSACLSKVPSAKKKPIRSSEANRRVEGVPPSASQW